MPIIDLNTVPKYRVLAHGKTGSGKTRWAATWPKVCMIAPIVEGGYETVRLLPKALLYDEKTRPVVWGLRTIADFMQGKAFAEKGVKEGRFDTIVIDSLTWYAEIYLQEMMGNFADGRQAYMAMQNHVINMMDAFHSLNAHILWLCTSRDESIGRQEAATKGVINIPGQKLYDKVPQLVHHILYFRSHRKKKRDPIEYEIRTRQFDTFPARVRGTTPEFPDPITNFTFREYEQLLIEDTKKAQA